MPSVPLYLTTAIEAVVRAGKLQMEQFGGDFQIDKKGTIDLVTEVDVAVERMFRALIAGALSRSPGAGRRDGRQRRSACRARAGCSIRSTARPTTRTGSRSSAPASRSRSTAWRKWPPCSIRTAQELFTAERGGGAYLNGRPLRVSAAGSLVDAVLVTGFPYDVHGRVDEIVGLFGAFVGQARAVRRLGSAAIDLCYVAAGRMDGFWESDLKPWDIAGGALIVTEAGGRVTHMDGSPFNSRCGDRSRHQRAPARSDARKSSGCSRAVGSVPVD